MGIPALISRPPSPRRRRIRRHLALALAVGSLSAGLAAVFPGPLRARVSLATAYVALGLLGVTLCLGPRNILRRRPNPVSFNQRRDFGIWSAVVGTVHAGVGLTVHLSGRMHLYFFAPPGDPNLLGLRLDAFGAANDTGLIAALLFLLLGLISNDLSLRTLGTGRWRAIQRWAYVLAALTAVHAALYQLVEKQRVVLVTVFAAVTATVLAMQVMGRLRFRDAARG